MEPADLLRLNALSTIRRGDRAHHGDDLALLASGAGLGQLLGLDIDPEALATHSLNSLTASLGAAIEEAVPEVTVKVSQGKRPSLMASTGTGDGLWAYVDRSGQVHAFPVGLGRKAQP